MMKVGYSIPVRIYYEDTDAGGVVYYANYLRFMERARSEWMRSMGFELDALARDEGTLFAVRSANLEYLRPARLSDLLEVSVSVTRRGRASIDLYQEITRVDELICMAQVRLVCVDSQGFAPRPIPKRILSEVDKWKTS
jgi:acyl-CoA thioester hydrolase